MLQPRYGSTMAATHPPIFQPSLFDAQTPAFDRAFSQLERIQLDESSWVDYAPAWVSGSDELFEKILESRQWNQRMRYMYTKKVREPRLTSSWNLRSGLPLGPAILEDLRICLSERYGVLFDSIGFNLYRDGEDSVAWHGDRIVAEIEEPVVALVCLGERRKFLLRSRGGGRSRPFQLGRGDLFVTGGKTQRTWEHCVPKVAHAGPRISLAFRYGMDPRAYGHDKTDPTEPGQNS
jgi:alkylated DNA repair dioxygenase AlkB